jgi:hypothetical protein
LAGHRSNYDTISLYGTGGQLTAQNGSTILNSYGGRAVVAGANTTSNLAGTVTVTNGGIGVSLGQGGTLNVGSTAVIDASSSSGSTNSSSAIQVTGTGTVIQIDGTVRNSSSFGGSTITMISRDFFANTVTGTGTVNISATGQVLSTGASSPAIILASGSTVNIAGLVRAYTASNAIDDRGTAGGTTTVNILAGGTVQSSGLPAIIGSAGAMNLTIAGTIRSGAASAVQLGSGNDVVTLVTGSSVDGAIDGGGGTNTLNLTGNGTGQLGTTTNFANVAINAGSWTLAAPVSASNGVTTAAGATGIGSASQWGSAISNAGTLVFNQSADETYTDAFRHGPIGQKRCRLADTGYPKRLYRHDAHLGRAMVINGFMPSPVTVASGATLAGNGRVGGLTVQSGGLVSPGTASGSGVGTLSVAGNFVQAAGSTYAAQVVGSNADQITVTGTATLAAGSKLVITTQNAVRGTRYTLLTANGGVNGQYTVVQSDIAYQLSYLGNSVVLTFGRSKEGMLALAQGANQLGAANALLGLPASATLYSTLGVASDDNTLRAAYPQLTGDLHGAVRAAILHTADMVTETALARSGMRQAGLHLWGQLLGSTGNSTGLRRRSPCRAKAMAV